jgi:hypothetical protein
MSADRIMGGGLIPSRPLKFGPVPEGLLAWAPDGGSETVAAWYGLSNPTDKQTGGRCGGAGAENMIEIMLRRDVPEAELHEIIGGKLGHLRWRIDGDRLHDDVRWDIYGDRNEGLRIADIEKIPRVTGILGNHGIKRIPKGYAARFAALKHGPVGAGVALGPGWNDPKPYVAPTDPNPRAGHFLCWVAAHTQAGASYDVALNSWGTAWGQDGLAIVHAQFTDYCLIDWAFQWVVEDGWWKRGAKWLEYVIESKAGGTTNPH